MTGTLLFTTDTTWRNKATFSSAVNVGDSPVVPATTIAVRTVFNQIIDKLCRLCKIDIAIFGQTVLPSLSQFFPNIVPMLSLLTPFNQSHFHPFQKDETHYVTHSPPLSYLLLSQDTQIVV